MFSGIIERCGTVRATHPQDGAMRLDIETGFTDLELGESVAINGVCLTVTAHEDSGFAAFFASTETLDRSNLGALRTGSVVNLERAVTLNTRLSGHMVQGHVDGRATLAAVREEAESHVLDWRLPEALYRYCVEKGSITLNGVSLTLNAVSPPAGGVFEASVTIIPHTWTHTNLELLQPGAEVNVEVDVIAKYVERLWQPRS